MGVSAARPPYLKQNWFGIEGSSERTGKFFDIPRKFLTKKVRSHPRIKYRNFFGGRESGIRSIILASKRKIFMSYSDFNTIGKVKQAFGLRTNEDVIFLPEIPPIAPSVTLASFLEESLPVAVATGSEKARSELIIAPVLLEVRKILKHQISVFSGEDFTVDASIGLSGTCDFLISRSPEQLEIEAPAIVIVEAKKADLKLGIGQCVAEMVAAQKFNEANSQPVSAIYGCVTSGSQWRFMKLEEQTVTIDFSDYPLPPVDQILGFLVWMVSQT